MIMSRKAVGGSRREVEEERKEGEGGGGGGERVHKNKHMPLTTTCTSSNHTLSNRKCRWQVFLATVNRKS